MQHSRIAICWLSADQLQILTDECIVIRGGNIGYPEDQIYDLPRPRSHVKLVNWFDSCLIMVLESRSARLSTPEGGSGLKDVAVQESVIEVVDTSKNPSLTVFDRSDMRRLGKKQEYRRVFGPAATFGFISMYLCTWECTCLSSRRFADQWLYPPSILRLSATMCQTTC